MTGEGGRSIGVVLEAAPGDGSFIDHAVHAVDRLREEGAAVDVRVLDGMPPDPRWDAVLAHGAGTQAWAGQHATDDRRIVLTDWPDTHPATVTAVDWAWWQATYCIAWVASYLGVAPLVVLAGPPVATQRRLATAVRSAEKAAGGSGATVHFLEGFGDHEGARQVWAGVVQGEPGLLLSTGGPASEAVCADARAAGWATAGFARGQTQHTYAIASDLPGALHELLTRMAGGAVDDDLVRFGFASGRLEVRPGVDAPAGSVGLLAAARDRLPAVCAS